MRVTPYVEELIQQDESRNNLAVRFRLANGGRIDAEEMQIARED